MVDKINAKSGWGIVLRSTGTVSLVAASLVISDPIWAAIFSLAVPLVNAWGEFGCARTQELVEFTEKHKEEFLEKIIRTDKFKSIFINIVERHFKEVDKDKRKLYRLFLLNVGRGVEPKFDYLSKALLVLDQITFEELRAVDVWSGRLQEAWIIKNNKRGCKKEDIDKEIDKIGVNEHQFMFAFEKDKIKPTMEQLVQNLRALGNYGLLSVRDTSGAILGDGSEGIRVKITKFGKIFLGFIRNDL